MADLSLMEPWELKPAADLGMPPPQRARSLAREIGLVETVLHWAWWCALRSHLALYHRLKIEGRAQLPVQAPFVLVANHASHLDALVLAAPLSWRLRDRVFPIAAGDTFFETPGKALFAAFVLNALPMWRRSCGPHAIEALRHRLLQEPCGFILFPEGTRTRDGRMGSFKPGLGMLVAGTEVPVIPCHLQGGWAALPPGRSWPRPSRLTLRVGPPLRFAAVPNERAGWVTIARETESAVRALAGGNETRA